MYSTENSEENKKEYIKLKLQHKSFVYCLLTVSLLSNYIFMPTLTLAQKADSNSLIAGNSQNLSIYQKLDEYEKTLFGESRNKQSIEKRLQNVEKELFGKTFKSSKSEPDSTSRRILSIDKIMAGKNSQQYLPPEAPGMDRSNFAPTPVSAPDNPVVTNNDSYRESDIPVADNNDRITGLLRQAMQNYANGKSVEAEKLYKQVLAMDFRNTDANYNLGAIAEEKGDLKGAQSYYSTALRTSPDDQDIKAALSAVQTKLKENTFSQASKSANNLTYINPANKESSTKNGQLSDNVNDPSMPMTAGDKQIADQAAFSFKTGKFDEAIQKLNYLAKKNPYDANIQFALGQAYRAKGNNNDAIRHLRAASTLAPKNDMYLNALNQIQDPSNSTQQSAINGMSTANSSIANSTGQTEQIQPFTNLPTSNSLSDENATMIGSVSSFGNSGYTGTGSGGVRLRRVMQAGLSGAAMGALMNRGYPGGMTKGAMRGAMYGGLFGLMMGGY